MTNVFVTLCDPNSNWNHTNLVKILLLVYFSIGEKTIIFLYKTNPANL